MQSVRDRVDDARPTASMHVCMYGSAGSPE